MHENDPCHDSHTVRFVATHALSTALVLACSDAAFALLKSCRSGLTRDLNF